MAFLYKRRKSPFWWIRLRHGQSESTKLRIDNIAETRKAQQKLNLAIRKESAEGRQHPTQRWERWVPDFLRDRYETSPRSRARYEIHWRAVSSFLKVQGVEVPDQLSFEIVSRYLAWRRTGCRDYGIKPCQRNTAIADIKFLGILMRRAVQLGFAITNPCVSLGLKRSKPKPRPEITPEHLAMIWRELQNEPDWMATAFMIARYTGCRLRETPVPIAGVDLQNRIIHFPVTKWDRPFSAPLRAELVPLFEKLRETRGAAALAFDLPQTPSTYWWRFFHRIGLPQYCFHCLRYTFAKDLARSGVPLSEAKMLMNHSHSSDLIALAYRELSPQDLRQHLDRVRFAPLK